MIITLSKKFEINGKKTNKIKLKEPKTGELYGISLLSLAQMEFDAIIQLLPKVSDMNQDQAKQLTAKEYTTAGIYFAGLLTNNTKKGATKLLEPLSEHLAGLSVLSLLQMETNEVVKLLPQISTLTEKEIVNMSCGDLFALATRSLDFFVSGEKISPQTT